MKTRWCLVAAVFGVSFLLHAGCGKSGPPPSTPAGATSESKFKSGDPYEKYNKQAPGAGNAND
jgi:hypothetical protein